MLLYVHYLIFSFTLSVKDDINTQQHAITNASIPKIGIAAIIKVYLHIFLNSFDLKNVILITNFLY